MTPMGAFLSDWLVAEEETLTRLNEANNASLSRFKVKVSSSAPQSEKKCPPGGGISYVQRRVEYYLIIIIIITIIEQ